jgi:phenylalanine-4-hydroxylase
MSTVSSRFKELFLASSSKDRQTILLNLKNIFRVYYEKEDENDMCYCGLTDLYSMLDTCSDHDLRKSNVWNSFEDADTSELLCKVVESGLDIFAIKGAW